jgi:3',5'-cyclic AMP phosphodiesterase CpdA
MKIIQLSDTHILSDKNSKLFGINTYIMLEKALKSIKENHLDADFLVITGDLTQDGEYKSFLNLRELISDFPIPIKLILGNHDKKDTFNKVFDICSNDNYVQYSLIQENKAFIFLDSTIKNEEYGILCDERLQWLDKECLKYKNKDIYLFMHHFPLNSKLLWMEENAYFKNKKEFWDIALKHNIKHIFTGHLHRIINANYKEIGVSCNKSTNFQVAYSPNNSNDYKTNVEKPTYAIIDIDTDFIIIHNHEFLNEDKTYILDSFE